MIYRCIKCLNLSTRPNTSLKKGGICEPCSYALQNENTPFNSLLENFWTHIDRITNGKSRSELKFVLGVSGGKDSLRQAEFCRHTLGIEPTLVSVGYPPSMTSLVGVQNLNNLFKKNYEIYNAFPATKTYKKLAKDCFFNLGNLKVAMEIALFNGAARMADLAGADIILWGENPAYSVGDENSATGDYLDGSGIYKINTLSLANKISEDIRVSNSFFYDISDGVKRVAPKLVFMGGVMPSWSQISNGISSIFQGFRHRSGSVVDYLNISAVDEDFVLINQYIKYLKYGFGRTTDILNEFIRAGIISRENALLLLDKYEPYIPSVEIDRFSKFIDVSPELVWSEINKNINNDLFEFDERKIKASEAFLGAR